jgi:hypothetical protein
MGGREKVVGRKEGRKVATAIPLNTGDAVDERKGGRKGEGGRGGEGGGGGEEEEGG